MPVFLVSFPSLHSVASGRSCVPKKEEKKKNPKPVIALCTTTKRQMGPVSDKRENIEGRLAAKEANISHRPWWRPKVAVRHFDN